MSNPEAWKTWEGRVVDGKYRLRQWLGGSDHSAVFLTDRYGQPGQKAAIKLIATTAGDAHPQLLRWRTAAQLSHPHLIRIYETGRCQMDGSPHLYVAMEFAEEDLSQILPQRPLAPAEVTDLLPPLLDALSYLHGQKLVHRRVKPSNILAVGDLLKLSSDQIAAPAESVGAGRRRDVYDAPETATGIASPAGDLWSVGATLVEALTQNAPVVDEASQRDPDVPADIAEPFRGIARECLHVDPKRRCSIGEIKARLQPAGRSVPAEPEAAPPPQRAVPRGRLVAVSLAAVALIGLIIFFSRGKSVPAPAATTEQSTPQTSPQPAPQVRAQSAKSASPKPPTEPSKRASGSRGEVVHQVLPDIPQSAKNTITGTIKIGVRVDVDSSGKVTAAKLAPAGPSKYFANLALRAAQQWEFSPPQVDGQPTASAWLLRFHLKRTSIQVVPERLKR